MNNTPRITASIRRKSLLLLNMQYKPSELAEELGITKQTILKYAEKFGLPSTKDKSGHVWIVGTDFTKWALGITKELREKHLKKTANDFYCNHCKDFVTVKTFEHNPVQNPLGKTERLSAVCPNCNAKLSKFARLEND